MFESAPYRTAAYAADVALLLLALSAALTAAWPSLRRACAQVLPRRRRLLGTLLVAVVVVLWTGSSIAVQLVFEQGQFRKPFFLTYFSTCAFAIYLPFYPRRLAKVLAVAAAGGGVRYTLVGAHGHATAALEGTEPEPEPEPAGKVAALPPRAALSAAARLGLLFFGYQLAFNVGLELSTVSSCTVIAASSGLWTLLSSALLLRERVGPIKLLSTLLTFGGVLVVVLTAGRWRTGAAGAAGSSPRWGNAYTLLSALLYGGYAALLKREVPDERALPMPFLFGLIGLCCTLLLLPALPLLHLARLERFAWPSHDTLLAMALNALLGSVVSNMLLARAMLLASPLVATVGLSLSIPLAIASDVVRGRGRLTHGLLLGTGFVWAGFIGVAVAEPLQKRACAGAHARRGAASALVDSHAEARGACTLSRLDRVQRP